MFKKKSSSSSKKNIRKRTSDSDKEEDEKYNDHDVDRLSVVSSKGPSKKHLKKGPPPNEEDGILDSFKGDVLGKKTDIYAIEKEQETGVFLKAFYL